MGKKREVTSAYATTNLWLLFLHHIPPLLLCPSCCWSQSCNRECVGCGVKENGAGWEYAPHEIAGAPPESEHFRLRWRAGGRQAECWCPPWEVPPLLGSVSSHRGTLPVSSTLVGDWLWGDRPPTRHWCCYSHLRAVPAQTTLTADVNVTTCHRHTQLPCSPSLGRHTLPMSRNIAVLDAKGPKMAI